MNGNSQQFEPSALKRMYTKPAPLGGLGRGYASGGPFLDRRDCWGFPFHHLTATHYTAKDQRLMIDWALGTIMGGRAEGAGRLRRLFQSLRDARQGLTVRTSCR